MYILDMLQKYDKFIKKRLCRVILTRVFLMYLSEKLSVSLCLNKIPFAEDENGAV